MPKVSAVGITLSGAIGIGVSQGFSITAAVAYANPNTTSLNEVLDEDKISWLSKVDTFYTFDYLVNI